MLLESAVNDRATFALKSAVRIHLLQLSAARGVNTSVAVGDIGSFKIAKSSRQSVEMLLGYPQLGS
jgi:hypothetical protein